ncbi:Reverse transcriptase domain-containing protein [Aphis craccivora]|uniref:Reverse transcriptase domain-containing protein n=1 Tax=Aphis craccivora TaxID=307492 RepID=A0A6G0Y6L9_APHCR|nr:Reverse transcriptase domain-containing protein [Aphis craccivora]
MIPSHFLAWERAQRYKRRNKKDEERVAKEIRVETLNKWQEEWNNGIRKLIQDVKAWTSRKHGTVEFIYDTISIKIRLFRSLPTKI